MALHAGVDIDLHSGTYLEQLPKLVRDGKVPIAEVDAAVRRVLEAKYKLGLFDDPYRYGDRSGMTEAVLEQHRALARQAARQAMVLLRNTGVVHLKKAGTIAVIGPMADLQRDGQGATHALGDPPELVTMLAANRGIAEEQGQGSDAEGVNEIATGRREVRLPHAGAEATEKALEVRRRSSPRQ